MIRKNLKGQSEKERFFLYDLARVTGSILQAYIICTRQSWLMSRNISGNQYNEFIAIGRLLSDETYKRDKKEIMIGGNKIDIIRQKDGVITLIETKKSSKMIEASQMQLLFYLYNISKRDRTIKGEIRIPKEKKVFPMELTEERIVEIEELISEIRCLLQQESAPQKEWIKFCKTCSYLEFCWS